MSYPDSSDKPNEKSVPPSVSLRMAERMAEPTKHGKTKFSGANSNTNQRTGSKLENL
jgi:hypothetical protein